MKLQRSLGGAIAGSLAAAVWAAQQPVDKRAFECEYDDVELLGKLVTREREWPLAGLAIHLANGALFGAAYAQARPFIPAPPVAAGALACPLQPPPPRPPAGAAAPPPPPPRRPAPAGGGTEA